MCARVLSGSRTSSYRDRATSSASSLADKTRARRVQSRERTASLFCGPIDGTQKQKRGPPGSGGFGPRPTVLRDLGVGCTRAGANPASAEQACFPLLLLLCPEVVDVFSLVRLEGAHCPLLEHGRLVVSSNMGMVLMGVFADLLDGRESLIGTLGRSARRLGRAMQSSWCSP